MVRKPCLIWIIAVCIAGCSHGDHLGKSWSWYTVHNGDSLYAIAKSFQMDMLHFASLNHLHAPFVLHPGQRLRVPSAPLNGKVLLTKPDYIALTERQAAFDRLIAALLAEQFPVKQKKLSLKKSSGKIKAQLSAHSINRTSKTIAKKTVHSHKHSHWQLPANGHLKQHVDAASVHGVDIYGSNGASVLASKEGKVIYAGVGGSLFGQLIILQHANQFLSVYAYNKKNVVHQGEHVQQGQKIAIMGNGIGRKPVLYFEIRHHGKRVPPMKLLLA